MAKLSRYCWTVWLSGAPGINISQDVPDLSSPSGHDHIDTQAQIMAWTLAYWPKWNSAPSLARHHHRLSRIISNEQETAPEPVLSPWVPKSITREFISMLFNSPQEVDIAFGSSCHILNNTVQMASYAQLFHCHCVPTGMKVLIDNRYCQIRALVDWMKQLSLLFLLVVWWTQRFSFQCAQPFLPIGFRVGTLCTRHHLQCVWSILPTVSWFTLSASGLFTWHWLYYPSHNIIKVVTLQVWVTFIPLQSIM